MTLAFTCAFASHLHTSFVVSLLPFHHHHHHHHQQHQQEAPPLLSSPPLLSNICHNDWKGPRCFFLSRVQALGLFSIKVSLEIEANWFWNSWLPCPSHLPLHLPLPLPLTSYPLPVASHQLYYCPAPTTTTTPPSSHAFVIAFASALYLCLCLCLHTLAFTLNFAVAFASGCAFTFASALVHYLDLQLYLNLSIHLCLDTDMYLLPLAFCLVPVPFFSARTFTILNPCPIHPGMWPLAACCGLVGPWLQGPTSWPLM